MREIKNAINAKRPLLGGVGPGELLLELFLSTKV